MSVLRARMSLMTVTIWSVFAVASSVGDPLSVVETKLRPTALSEAAAEDQFGNSVAISGDRIAVGVPGPINTMSNEGQVDIYVRKGSIWVREALLVEADGDEDEAFGVALALDGDMLAVGAFRNDISPDTRGVVYIFERSDAGWVRRFRFDALPPFSWYPGGMSLAVSGERVVAGYPYENGAAGEAQGAVYTFRRVDGVWGLHSRLTEPDAAEYTAFGYSVAIDADDLLVGAVAAANPSSPDGGAAYVFAWDGDWTFTDRLVPVSGVGYCGSFAQSVALAGDTIAIGQVCSSHISGPSGSVTVFERTSQGWATGALITPPPDETTNNFAVSVSLSGDTLAVGAAGDWPIDELVSTTYVYRRGAGGWNREAGLDSPGHAEDSFGVTVSLSGERLIVGAPLRDGLAGAEQGAANVYVRSGANWSGEAILARATSDLSDGDGFGGAVAVQDDILLVSAPGDSDQGGAGQGAVYVYQLENDRWVFRRKLLAPDGQTHDNFGHSLAISGDRVVVGAWVADSPAGPNSGAAYVFLRQGMEFLLEARLYPQGGTTHDRYGNAVAIDGERIVVGAYYGWSSPEGNRGAAYVYSRDTGVWIQQARFIPPAPVWTSYFGASVAISGDCIAVGGADVEDELGVFRAAVHVYREFSGQWSLETQLMVSDMSAGGFGKGLAMQADRVVVGAPSSHQPYSERGRVFVFSHSAGIWAREAVLEASHPTLRAYFGEQIAIHDDRLAIGAGGERDGANLSRGAAYLFARDGAQWTEVSRVTASDSYERQGFGGDALGFYGSRMIVGVPNDGPSIPPRYGAVYDYAIRCAGDVNGDWHISAADLTILLSHFGVSSGAMREDGDLDRDGDVDLHDLSALLSDFGVTCR